MLHRVSPKRKYDVSFHNKVYLAMSSYRSFPPLLYSVYIRFWATLCNLACFSWKCIVETMRPDLSSVRFGHIFINAFWSRGYIFIPHFDIPYFWRSVIFIFYFATTLFTNARIRIFRLYQAISRQRTIPQKGYTCICLIHIVQYTNISR